MFWCSEGFSRLRKVHSVKGWSGSRLGKDEECGSCPLLCISLKRNTQGYCHGLLFKIKFSEVVGKEMYQVRSREGGNTCGS